MSQPSTQLRLSRRSWLVMQVLIAGCLFGGCMTPFAVRREPPVNPAAEAAGTYKVIMAGKMGRPPKVFVGRLEQDITIQQALEESGASKRLVNMQIDLARLIPERGEVLRLPVKYKPSDRTVAPEQNYAIHPGDEILIRPASNGPIDAIMRVVSGSDDTHQSLRR